MKKTRLKPYVHKIKGAKNYALYDLLKGNFYILTPAGDVDQLKKSLKEAGLTFETDGIVPFKTEIDMEPEKNVIHIRELQIRLNGRTEDNCRNRYKTGKEKRFMTTETLALLNKQLKHIPVKRIHLESESNEPGMIEFILTEFPFEELLLFIESGLDENARKRFKSLVDNREKNFTILTNGDNGKKNMKDLEVEIYDFFYHQRYNPCLGHQVAVDCGGEIKPCLWWKETLGTIDKNNLKDMINREVFDEYWKLSKDKINVCKDCELRYACPDCRINYPITGDFLTKKPGYCDYNPYTGIQGQRKEANEK